jgi:sugar/nucleoside kinase (ribokinase family)
MFDVITIGSATRDVFLRSRAMELHKEHGIIEACFPFGAKLNVEEITIETGGGATNNAVTFARLGRLKAAALAVLGNDRPADDVISALRKDRVDTRLLTRAGGKQTGYSTILLSGAAERTILTFRGASAQMADAKNTVRRLKTRLFHVSSLGGDLGLLTQIIARAKEINARVFINPGDAEIKQRAKLLRLLKKTDLLFVNREEAALLTGAPRTDLNSLIKKLRQINKHVVLTDGPAGSYAITPSDILHAGIVPCRRVNLTGAGDAFGSGYALGIIKFDDIRTALAVGTLNATGVVQHTGAKIGILRAMPPAAELERVKITKISI